MALTQIDLQTFNTAVQGHSDVASYIQQQRTKLTNEVQTAQSQNSGNMITSLVKVHEDWDNNMADIIKNLNTMIEAMQQTAQGLHYQDAANHA